MADDASRLWHLTNAQLLSHFEQTYPQSQPWQLRILPPPMLSALTSALQRQRVAPQSVLNEPTRTIIPGPSGSTSVPPTTSIPYWRLSRTPSRTYRSLHNATAMAALPKMVSPSDLAQWRTPFVPLARRWPDDGQPGGPGLPSHCSQNLGLPPQPTTRRLAARRPCPPTCNPCFTPPHRLRSCSRRPSPLSPPACCG
jgi:hypothetical protein